MSAWGLVTMALGAATVVGCILAARAGHGLKKQTHSPSGWVLFYWIALGGYALFFTIQRLAAELGASDATVTQLYYIATSFGASTLVALSAIMFRVRLPAWPAGYMTGVLTAAAVWIVYLIIAPGVIGPSYGTWSTEFLPSYLVVRILIAVVYMGIPLVFAAWILQATQKADPEFRRRMILFMVSVLLVYESNAIKYVVALPDVVHLFLTAAMTVGVFIGWRSYLTPDPSGNG